MTVMARFTLLLFVLGVGVAVATVVDLQKRIIGGQTCGLTERLYHVQLIASHGNSVGRCGGSLISDQWILTAAHCWEPGWTLKAVLGVHPGSQRTEVPITEQPVIFKDKDNNNNDRPHDIMLLKLPKPSQIQPIGLPDCRNRPQIGGTVQIAGHAATAAGQNNRRQPGRSNTLQCADINVVDCQRLRNIKSFTNPQRLYQHWFCGQTPGVDACPGDSGGGVVFQDRIYGVISFTGDVDFACTEAAGFMDVCAYKQWIENTIARPKNSKLGSLMSG